ncbi:hypothetical protein [Agromyces sp. ZXT2-6]|uniref:hypothetical protein n=1 Tax=Agromyces sp. ZXT2-6 TaxID=3461153 RepID=UPI0040552751
MYKPLSVAEVLLDEENPRFPESVDSQADAINALLDLGREKMIALARDIAESDALDPTNPPIVWESEGDRIVLEGNRRLAALKLLRNPQLARASATQRAFERIRKEAQGPEIEAEGPEEIVCWVVSSREEAHRWIELRHTGQNGGVGTDPWNSYQSNTFRRQKGTANDRAWLVVRAALSTFADDQTLVSDVRTVRDTKFTNLSRLLGRPYVREAFKISVVDDEVTFRSQSPFYVDVLRTMFSDLVSMPVDAIMTGEKQDEYADAVLAAVREQHPEEERDAGSDQPSDPDGEGAESGGGTSGTAGGGSNVGGTATGGEGGTTSTRTRRRSGPRVVQKVFYGLNLSNFSTRTVAVLKEAQKVKIDDAPSVCAVMVRVVVELCVTEVGVEQEWFAEGLSLRKKLRKVLLELDPDCANPARRDKSLEMAWIRSQADDGDGLAVDEMNAYVHNYAAHPDGDRVRALCEAFKPMLVRLDQLLEEERAA